MPIFIKKMVVKNQHEDRREELNKSLLEKRAERVTKRRERYQLKRPERCPQDYDKIKIIVDGEEKHLSQGSKFLLDHLVKD